MTNETIYLLETLAVTVPAAGGILYIVNNLRTKLKAALEKVEKQSKRIVFLEADRAYMDSKQIEDYTKEKEATAKIEALEFELNERKAAAEAKSVAPGTAKIKEIFLEPGPVGDPIKLNLIDDDGHKVTVTVTTEQQVEAIVSKVLSNTVQEAASHAFKKTRWGVL